MEDYSPDRALEILVNVVNGYTEPAPDGAFGVVLTTGGLVVSGVVIPNWQWLDEVGRQVSDAVVEAGGEAGKGWDSLFTRLAAEAAKGRDEQKTVDLASEDWSPHYQRALSDAEVTQFIHLKHARVYNATKPLPDNGMYWRGRLSEISGWSVGVMGDPVRRG